METVKQQAIYTSTILKKKQSLGHELVRKSLHVSIALVPGIAQVAGVSAALALLGAGVIFYTFAEYFRLQGKLIPVVSKLTSFAMRERENNQFVMGPVTLAIGTMLALMLYPEPAASAGIYALAFGDGIASLAGKAFGSIKIPFTGGKSLEGSLACFIAVFASCLMLIPGFKPHTALLIAFAATVLEALPSRDFDNVLLPVGVGSIALLLI